MHNKYSIPYLGLREKYSIIFFRYQFANGFRFYTLIINGVLQRVIYSKLTYLIYYFNGFIILLSRDILIGMIFTWRVHLCAIVIFRFIKIHFTGKQ